MINVKSAEDDLYAKIAEYLANNKPDHLTERQVGKARELQAGYGLDNTQTKETTR